MKKLLPAFLFFISFTILLGACRRGSHAVSSILLLADSLMQSHPDSSLQLLEAIPAPQKMGKTDRAWYALLLTQAKYKNYVSLENDSLIQVAVDYFEKNSDREQLAKSYFYSGCVHREQEDISTAINLYLKSLRTMPQGSDSAFLSMVYNDLGDCYTDQNMEETARNMYRQAYAINVNNHDTLRAFHNLSGIGGTFLLELQFDSALIYYQQALEMVLLLDYPVLLGVIYKNLSGVYNEQGEYGQANDCISRAIPYLLDIESSTSAYSLKGDILYNLGKKDSAFYYWNLGKNSSDIYTKTSNYYSIYQANKELSNWKDAILNVDSFIVYYDSIQSMNDRAEINELMDKHLLELHKYKLSTEHRRTMNLLIILSLFFILVLSLIFMWRDRCRKNKYIALQKQLMDNRAEILLYGKDICEEENSKLHELKELRIDICISLFRSTEGSKKLTELMKAKPKERISIIHNHRVLILNDIRRTFVDIMEDLNACFSSLTMDDLLYCILVILHCPKEIIMDVMNTTSDAIKTRKNRIKNKMDKELFEKVFMSDNV